MSKENYFFRKNSFGVYLSPERKEILEQNYETVFGTDGDLKPAEAFWLLFETALNQNTAKCNLKELEELKKLNPMLEEKVLTLQSIAQKFEIMMAEAQEENRLLKLQIEELQNRQPEKVEITKEVSVEVPAKVGENQVLITFTPMQKAMLEETRRLLLERGIDYSDDEILARLFVGFTIKGPWDYYPRVLKSAIIAEMRESFKE